MTTDARLSKSTTSRWGLSSLRLRGLELILPASALLAACMGDIGGNGPTDGAPSVDGDGDGNGNPTVPPPGSPACVEASVGPGPLRRLTGEELTKTVNALAGISIADLELQADSHVGEFRTNADAPMHWTNASDFQQVAERVALHVRDNVADFAPCNATGAAAEAACLDVYLDDFGKRAFRRPLRDEERSRYHDLFTRTRTELSLGFPGGVRLVTEAMLQSPIFAYHVEIGADVEPLDSVVPLTPYELASRLSFFLWGTMPDAALFAAAEAGELDTAEGVGAHVDRMLTGDTGKAHIRSFFVQWLGLETVTEIDKDPALFPTFDAEAAAAMRASSEAFLDEVMWEGDGLYSTLLTSPVSYVSAPIAGILGVSGDFGPTLERVELDASKRPGFLSHPAILALTSHPNQTSPVHRGLFVRSRLLCGAPPPPPPELMVGPIPLDPSKTTKERLEQHAADVTCAGCHQLMDPIGLPMENYDAIGQYRETENGKPIDNSGEIVGSDVPEPFNGIAGLAERLAESTEAAVCAERQMMTFALGRKIAGDEVCTLGESFVEATPGELDFRQLARAIATSDSFRFLRVTDRSACE